MSVLVPLADLAAVLLRVAFGARHPVPLVLVVVIGVAGALTTEAAWTRPLYAVIAGLGLVTLAGVTASRLRSM